MANYFNLRYARLSIYIVALLVLSLLFYIIHNKKRRFPNVPLIDIDRNEIANIHCGKYIALIFSPTDCSICLDEIISALNEIEYKKSKKAKIIGIINSINKQSVARIKDNYEIHFALMQDTTFATKTFFSKSSQSFLKPILIQLSNGKIIKKGIIGEPREYHKIKQILNYLENGD
jgi:hypothetical protein